MKGKNSFKIICYFNKVLNSVRKHMFSHTKFGNI